MGNWQEVNNWWLHFRRTFQFLILSWTPLDILQCLLVTIINITIDHVLKYSHLNNHFCKLKWTLQGWKSCIQSFEMRPTKLIHTNLWQHCHSHFPSYLNKWWQTRQLTCSSLYCKIWISIALSAFSALIFAIWVTAWDVQI